MADIQVTAVAKIIEGALENDLEKVRAYAEHIANYLDERGEKGSRIIRSKLDGTYKNKNKVVLDNLKSIPKNCYLYDCVNDNCGNETNCRAECSRRI